VDFKEYKVELETAIDTALKNRPEIEQYNITLQTSELDQRATRNSRKWVLDLTSSFGTNGTAGPQGYKTNLDGTYVLINGQRVPSIKPALVGGLFTSWKTLFLQRIYNWSVGFNITVPLRSRSLDATLAQQMISQRQTLLQKRKQEQAIQVEIRNAVQRLQTNRSQVETAKKAVELSKEQLSGEQKRFDAGLSENFRVLDRQNQLVSQEKTYLDTLITYKQSVIALQKSMYILLESNELDMAKGSSTKVPALE
jgi:outer membrane protein TolC